MLDFGEVECEVIGPEAGAAADGGGLSGLQVRVAEGGEVAIFFGEVGQREDDRGEASGDHAEGFADENEVGVVGDVAAGGAEMDDRASGGAGVAIGVDVGHHVVAELAFVFGGGVEVDVGDVGDAARRFARG